MYKFYYLFSGYIYPPLFLLPGGETLYLLMLSFISLETFIEVLSPKFRGKTERGCGFEQPATNWQDPSGIPSG
jgi:hypothetical protein